MAIEKIVQGIRKVIPAPVMAAFDQFTRAGEHPVPRGDVARSPIFRRGDEIIRGRIDQSWLVDPEKEAA